MAKRAKTTTTQDPETTLTVATDDDPGDLCLQCEHADKRFDCDNDCPHKPEATIREEEPVTEAPAEPAADPADQHQDEQPDENPAQRLAAIRAANDACNAAMRELDIAKEIAKEAKAKFDAAVARLRSTIAERDEHYPLFDQARAAEAAAEAADDAPSYQPDPELWRDEDLSALDISEATRRKLTEAGFANCGELSDYLQRGKLVDIDGIGPAVAAKISDAWTEFWKAHDPEPVEEPDAVAENAAAHAENLARWKAEEGEYNDPEGLDDPGDDEADEG